MDVFVEQLIRKKKGRKDCAIVTGADILGIVILIINTLITFLDPFLLVIVTGMFVGICCVGTSKDLEYEYSTTNGDLTVDQVTSRHSRKRTCSFDLKTVEEMRQHNALAPQNRSLVRQLMVGEDNEGTDAWYLIVYLKDSGNTLFVFNPNERVLAAIRPFLPQQVSVNAFRGSRSPRNFPDRTYNEEPAFLSKDFGGQGT